MSQDTRLNAGKCLLCNFIRDTQKLPPKHKNTKSSVFLSVCPSILNLQSHLYIVDISLWR